MPSASRERLPIRIPMPSVPASGLPGLAFAAVAAAVPPLALFAPRASTPAVIALTIVCLAVWWRQGRPVRVFDKGIAGLLAGLVAWAALSIMWSLDSTFAVRGVLKLAGNLLVGGCLLSFALALAADARGAVERALMVGMGLCVFVLAVEALFDAPMYRLLSFGPGGAEELFYFLLGDYGQFWLKPATSLTALFVWPVILALARRGRFALAVVALAAVLAVAYGLGNTTALAALALGTLTAGVVFVFRRRAGVALAAILAVGIVGAPLMTATVLKPRSLSPETEFVSFALLHRLYIWEFAAEAITQHPARGWGMNASRVLPGGKERVFDDFRQMSVGQVMPLHPHNLSLQMWLELGLPGALLAGALVALVLLRLTRRRLDRSLSTIACGQFAAGFVISSFSFGAWQSWWLAALWLAASLTAIIGRPQTPPVASATMRRPRPG